VSIVTAEKVEKAIAAPLDELKSGWLLKRKIKVGKKASAWKKRFCVLREDGLSYYAQETDENRMGVIAFSNVQAVELHLAHPLIWLNCVGGEYDFSSESSSALLDLRSWAQIIASKADVVLTEQKAESKSDVKAVGSGAPPPRPTSPPKRAAAAAAASDEVLAPEKMQELITSALHYVHRKGLYRVNIFRVNEDQSEVDLLAAAWQRGQRVDLEKESVDVVAVRWKEKKKKNKTKLRSDQEKKGAVRKFFRDVASLLSVSEVDTLLDSTRLPPQQQVCVFVLLFPFFF
jgi:hypothetical protein